MFNRHKHNWELLDKTVLPPGIRSLDNVKMKGTTPHSMEKVVAQMIDATREHVVLTFKCTCGQVKIETRS